MDNITLVGTSHISPDSLREVVQTIRSVHPDFVAVELDRNRLIALTQKEKRGPGIRDISRIGLKGWLFAKLGGWVERSLGAKVGVSPGDEMLRAVAVAHEVDAKLALIDRDIEVTLKRFNKALSWRERWNFFVDMVKGLFGRSPFKFDISTVPSQELINVMIKEVSHRYPNVYRVLIEERNIYMAKSLVALMRRYPEARIVAVVGAGHVEDMRDLLKKYLNA